MEKVLFCYDFPMAVENGIVMDLFPPMAWDEESVRVAIEIQEAADGEEGWGFSGEELTFLARSISYYMGIDPGEWAGSFEIESEIDPEDPNEDGRFVINMTYPGHIEAPASLR